MGGDIGDIEETYEVLGRLSEDGGNGDLYVGRDRATGEKVAVKTQMPWRIDTWAEHEEYGEKLIEEGRLMLSLSGFGGIPELIATGTYQEDACLVMELIEGRQLRDVLTERRPVKDPGTIASIIGQLCETLQEVHRAKLVHCDLKPENVLVQPDGRLRLIDVGLAARIGNATPEGIGTTGYASPEQLEMNSQGLDGRSDIYGLGCMLLEMTVLRLPYGGLERRVRRGYPVLPPAHLDSIPPEFRDLALRMVQWEPEDRPADVREVFEQIRAYLPGPNSERPRKPLRPDPTEYYRTRAPRL
ncbi:serine/threonine-protein kinase [Streptomyces sp. NPDC020875]|uniref:serine/threonine protein kinase n=1 Tax=Streptomyces sp. NPDC020875 TaxID=3154898 RepID=UPI0033C281E8